MAKWKLPEGRQPLSWQDIPFAERPKHHPSTERLEIEKLKERVAELEVALGRLVTAVEDGCFCSEMEMATRIDEARAALKGKDDE